MAITKKSILSESRQADGSRRVRVKLTDSAGYPHTRTLVLQKSENAQARIDATAAGLQEALEKNEAFAVYFSGNAKIKIDQLTHGSKETIVKRVVNELMRADDVNDAIRLKPLIDKIQTDYTPKQLKIILGRNNAQLLALNRRLTAADNAKADLQDFDDEKEQTSIRASVR